MGAAPSSQTYLATFEMESNGGITGPNLSNPYDGLQYQGFTNGPFDEQAGDCAYVCAATFPAEAAFTATYSNTTANMTSNYAGSNVTHFTLSDFFFGCNGYFDGVVEPSTNQTYNHYESPVNCTINVVGYGSLSRPAVAKQTFHYQPQITFNRNTGAPKASMTHVSLSPAFQASKIKLIKFTATGPSTGYASGVGGVSEGPLAQSVPDVLVDSMNYTVYYS